ncbi:hypothetical protein CDL12_19469 [Handroanthus impetiginosus]|uniref:CCHC-type domain-containing protein n=1 Tax=Handroanthus impetiginosus TaxID=429701 RepID=A0A2G9GRM3_9LAMI|nr:hypothetical protein CDL12_19469 [Handroanthus impetiginosus]
MAVTLLFGNFTFVSLLKARVYLACLMGKAVWRSNNAKVISWLLNSVQVDIAIGLRAFVLTSEMWKHLRTVYTQCNLAREFELERSLVAYVQGEKDVRTFYSGLLAIWLKQDQNFGTLISTAGLQKIMVERKKSRVVQTTPDIDMVLSAILREETSLGTQSSMDASLSVSTALLASRSNSTFAGKPSQLQCFQCKEYGHIAAHCRKRNIYNYCKKPGHIILDCPKCPNRRPPTQQQAFQATVSSPVTQSSPFDSTELQRLIQEYVAVALPEAISTALSASYSGKSLLKEPKV